MDTTSSSKQILIFNSANILVGITKSAETASWLAGLSKKEVTGLCKSKTASSTNSSFRYLSACVEIELSDIGKLALEDYDKVAI